MSWLKGYLLLILSAAALAFTLVWLWFSRKKLGLKYPWTVFIALVGIALSRSCREGGILRKETARRMVTPVMDGYGLCIKRDDRIPDQVGHTGGNEGFIAYWTLSLTEDLCAAVMFNGSNRLNSAVAGPMCGFLDGLIESEKG